MIDYSLIADSNSFYERFGYKRIEAPWTVTPAVADITKPSEASVEWKIGHNGKVLVASGEQSFLYLYLKEFLPLGKFQATTPCFRFENFDELHTKYFIKNELIATDDVNSSTLDEMIENAKAFFCNFFPKEFINIESNKARSNDYMIETSSYDILVNIDGKFVELGSYGIRECSFLKWVYGTGCAEPRLSSSIEQFKNNHGLS